MLSRPIKSKAELLGMRAPRLFGFVPKQLRTGFEKDGEKVYCIHNPKAAGSSLKHLLDCPEGRTLHIWATGAFTRKVWEKSFIICSVRNPMSRFWSGYYYHVKSNYRGQLFKLHGEAFKSLSPEAYFDLMLQYPEYLGPQHLWFSYKGSKKSQCDLILRVEESENWCFLLQQQGIFVNETMNVRKNVSSSYADLIKPSRDLRARIEDYYYQDYEILGY